MDDKIEVSYVKQFSDNFRLALQDGASELRANVTEKDVGNAKAKSFDDIGRTDVIDKTARHPDTPEITIDHNRRWLRCNTRHWSTLIDEDDKIQMLADPTSDYLQTAKNAFGRKIDQVIVDAAFGPVTTGTDMETTENFPTANSMTLASSLTVDALTNIHTAMNKLHIPKTGRITVLTSDEMNALLKENKATNADYSAVKALVNGELNTFMGFKFITIDEECGGSKIIPSVKSGGDTYNRCFATQKEMIYFGMQRDITVKIDDRKDKSYSTQLYVSARFGAMRATKNGVLELKCKVG